MLEARGRRLSPRRVSLPELDEHNGIALVFKLLPLVAASDPELARASSSGWRAPRKPSVEDLLVAFKRITRRWVRGEIGHDEVESWSAFRARVAAAMTRIASVGRGKTALVFTSAGAIASAVAEALAVPDEEKVLDLSWSLHNGSLTELEFRDDRWGLRSFNGTPHLRDRRLITAV